MDTPPIRPSSWGKVECGIRRVGRQFVVGDPVEDNLSRLRLGPLNSILLRIRVEEDVQLRNLGNSTAIDFPIEHDRERHSHRLPPIVKTKAAAEIFSLVICRIPIYDRVVIQSYRDAETERIFLQQSSKRFRSIEKTALRKLIHLNQARSLRDLSSIPGDCLEILKGARKRQHSIRINDQYRICFVWKDGDAFDVEITDYH
jgi:proteic killer suppression protein